VKPYVWWGESGHWYLSMGKSPVGIIKSRQFDTWDDAMDAARNAIAHEPS
jgi:hypothetical protein